LTTRPYVFDNIADVLGAVAVRLIERYVVGRPRAVSAARDRRNRTSASARRHYPDAAGPLGRTSTSTVCRSARSAGWREPRLPAERRVRIPDLLLRTNTDSLIGSSGRTSSRFSIDGQRVFLDVIGGERDQPKRPAPRRERGADDVDEDTGPPSKPA
jgi:hypothetical protein